MIIVWRGAGILGLFIPVICTAIVYGSVGSWTGPQYMAQHRWPLTAGMVVSAVVVYLLCHYRDREGEGRDALYFIPLKMWSFIYVLIGIGFLFMGPGQESVQARSDSDAPASAAAVAGNGTVTLKDPLVTVGSASNSVAPGLNVGNGGISFGGKKWPPDPKPPRVERTDWRNSMPVQPQNVVTQTYWVADLKLESISYVPNGKSSAALSGRRVCVGDRINSYTVVGIQKDSVTLKAATGRRRTLRIGETEDPL